MLPPAAASRLCEDDDPARSDGPATEDDMAAVYKQAKATSYPCRVCGLVLPSSQSLGGHLSRVHGGSRSNDSFRQKPRAGASVKQNPGKSRFHSFQAQSEEGEEKVRRRSSAGKQLNNADSREPDGSQEDSLETNAFPAATEASRGVRTRPTNNQLL